MLSPASQDIVVTLRLYVGCQVTEGSGAILVLAVGENSEWGKTMALVKTESADTPLQDSLGSLAAAIGKLGLAVGVLCFIVLTIRCAAATLPAFGTPTWFCSNFNLVLFKLQTKHSGGLLQIH